ncbi:hypothetical protein [Ferrimonas aestuarii]|uniref:Uncharacterized protein n=1 Tax=Ferrimonas aestuarii TaxID=2569539 RepID=A0A4U1BMY9_9GAMM|nr:hypothetical protein [Ferrimonas aestuarii]TKB54717.1 hypothetical protein FCL42_11235 [Ferrimonas aestuarii]
MPLWLLTTLTLQANFQLVMPESLQVEALLQPQADARSDRQISVREIQSTPMPLPSAPKRAKANTPPSTRTYIQVDYL